MNTILQNKHFLCFVASRSHTNSILGHLNGEFFSDTPSDPRAHNETVRSGNNDIIASYMPIVALCNERTMAA